MIKAWSLAILIVAGSLAGCAFNSVSSDQETLLSMYLQNAAEYYDGGDFQRAYQQWGEAIAVDSGNEKARLGQVMALYQLGRVNSAEAMKPLGDATQRVDAMRKEDFDKDQWKVELAAALIHQRWCELYDRKLRKIAADEEKGVPPNPTELAAAKRELATNLDTAEQAFHNVLSGREKDPRDRLTCWLGLALIAARRDDLQTSLKYSQLYVDQILRSEKLWKDSAERYPREAPIFDAKYNGARMQEAELRDLMGAVLVRLDRPDEAEAQVNMVLAMFPQRATAYLNRGMLRQLRGEDDLARGDYRKFLSYADLPDTDPAILEATKRLAEVESRLAAQEAHDREAAPETVPETPQQR